jgi:salicylate hydroxylase
LKGQRKQDAYILGHLLSQPSTTLATLSKALAVYDRVRRPRASRVQSSSRDLGDVYEFAGPPGGDEDKRAETLQTWTKWIWEHDLEKAGREAVDALESAA